MVLTADEKAKALGLVARLDALYAPYYLLLLCKGVRQEVEAVMPALNTKRRLPWTVVKSILEKFPQANRLSFSEQSEGALIPTVAKRRGLHTLTLHSCRGVTDVSALAGCASLHTLNLSSCSGVTDVSAFEGLHVIS